MLSLLNKGVDGEGMVRAAGWTKDAGIELFTYVLISGGGRRLSREHVEQTVGVINRVEPHSVDVQTLIPQPNTPLDDLMKDGSFEPLSPHRAIREMRGIIEGINVSTEIGSEHISDYCFVRGFLLPGLTSSTPLRHSGHSSGL